MKSDFNAKLAVVAIGVILIMTGVASSAFNESTTVTSEPTEQGQSTLKVKKGNNLPTSTIDQLQGSGSVQGQGSAGPQSQNAGSSLQPNSGADALPDNY